MIRADFSRQAASKQALEDRPQEVELVEDSHRSLLSCQLEQSSTPDAVASSTTQASQAPITIPNELSACEHSLAKAYSSFTINHRPAAVDYQLAFLSDSGSKSNVTQLCDNGSVEAARITPLFSRKGVGWIEIGDVQPIWAPMQSRSNEGEPPSSRVDKTKTSSRL